MVVRELPTCTRCGRRRANFYRASSGERVCLQCLFNYIEDTTLKTIKKYRLIQENDKIGIAVSGGKDSQVLLYLLGKFKKLKKIPQSVELIAFTINEETPYSENYKIRFKMYIEKLCQEFDIPFKTYTFTELFGFKAIDLAKELWSKGRQLHMCTICGVLRRKAMNIIGKELKLTKIATAHNLDDEAQTVLLNVMNNDVKRFLWFGVMPKTRYEEFIPRIKPLRFLREEELALYAYYHNIPLMELECPFIKDNPRYRLKFTLALWEKTNPNIKYSIVSFGDSISKIMYDRVVNNLVKIEGCIYCGEVSSGKVCRACQLVKDTKYFDTYLNHLRMKNLITTQSE